MQIFKEETGKLTATVKIQITREDYEEKVQKTLKEYQRKASVPGFRPGKVPFGMISKMYRKGVLLDEINHLVAENIQKYIDEQQLKLIGSPVPNTEKGIITDLDTQEEFEFYFDLGLTPEFQVDLSSYSPVVRYKITATEKMIDQQVHDIRHRVSHMEHPEEHEHEESHENEEHHEHELPELNEAFYDKVFPGAEIKDEAAFRSKIREALDQSLAKESDRFLMNACVEKLVTETTMDLPDDFLKKMIRANNEQKLTEEQIEAQYDNFDKSIRWQLIESKIILENNIRVEEQEMRDVVKGYFTGNVFSQGENPEQDERLNKIVDSVLNNREEASRLHDQLFDQKLFSFFNTSLPMEVKEVDYDEFMQLITKKETE